MFTKRLFEQILYHNLDTSSIFEIYKHSETIWFHYLEFITKKIKNKNGDDIIFRFHLNIDTDDNMIIGRIIIRCENETKNKELDEYEDLLTISNRINSDDLLDRYFSKLCHLHNPGLYERIKLLI